MRLLHVSDFHFNKRWFAWLSEQAHRFDACCLTGDVLDLFAAARTPAVSLNTQASWVLDWLKDYRGPKLFICSGNNDWWTTKGASPDPLSDFGFLKAAAEANPLLRGDGTNEVMGGYRFICTSWGATPTLIKSRERVVLLAHAPAEGTALASGMGGGTDEMNTAVMAEMLPMGSMVLSGHNHSPHSWHDTLGGVVCFNPGCREKASVPNHIIIDTERRSAFFEGQGGGQGPVRV